MAKASQFLKLIDRRGKPVLGECIDADHVNEIDLNSWSWSVADPAALPKAEDAAPDDGTETKTKKKEKEKVNSESDADAKISPALFSISKKTDRSTVRLITAMDTGETFDEAIIVIEEEFEDSRLRLPFFMEIKLTEVLVVKLDLNVEAGSASAEFRENWDLNYNKIAFGYRISSGEGRGAKMPMDFDRPRDSGATAGKKVKKTAAEIKAEKKKDYEEWKKSEKKN